MSDIVERLRHKANEGERWDGSALTSWDSIRHQIETKPGSDIPRMNFETLIGGFTELMREAADEIDQLRAALKGAKTALLAAQVWLTPNVGGWMLDQIKDGTTKALRDIDAALEGDPGANAKESRCRVT